ncbi:suppressor of fused protein SUFU [Kribbella rubisoli]|uniref:Suppressor of fused protein SUFU n=1 Tax=Kribbella rubisoli TaxID=3075929 RepID=A0A4Q7X0T9_9ACTN|nr:suppressor of fused domain protein [Kribbella rubisoli]RZU16410.1 suppressor of fused protein SUFU [Kribbella rubisoli]
MTSMIKHFERQLGPIQDGWSGDPDSNEMPFQIVRFAQGSGDRTVAFATLGLGRYPLISAATGRTIRHELLLLVSEELVNEPFPSLLQEIGEEAIRDDRALLRGDLLGPRGPLISESHLEALYVTMPVYFPDDFATCDSPDGPIVIAWLVPVSLAEARYIDSAGWEAFEDRLIEQDPNLMDFSRKSVVV